MIGRIQYLDGIRGIAIIMVFFAHAAYSLPFTNDFKLMQEILFNAHLGVLLFFVLSGYLITTLLLKEKDKTGSINIKYFYFRRMLRIFPVFYLYLFVVTIGYYLGKIKISGYLLIAAALFLSNYHHLYHSPNIVESSDLGIVGHFWTLSLEEQFYLVWPTILILFGTLNTKKVLPIILCIYPFIRIATYLFMPSMRGQIGMMLHTMGDCIFYGGYAALLQRYDFDKVNKMLLFFRQYRFIPILMILFVFIFSPIITHYLKGAYAITIGFSLEGASIAMLLLFILHEQPKYCNFLNNKVLMYIGVLSYSIYVWHIFFLRTSTILNTFPLNLIATLITAFISYNFVELPILMLKNRFK